MTKISLFRKTSSIGFFQTRLVIAVPLKVGILRQACDPEAKSGDARRGQPVVNS